MADWALYVDESGDTKPHSLPVLPGQSPVFALVGVALPINRWRDYDREYLSLKYKFFKSEIDKSTKRREQWEFKGKRLIAPRAKKAKTERLRVFGYRMLDLINSYDGKLFSITFVKNNTNPMVPQAMYNVAIQYIAERFDIFLREKDARGIIIADSRMAHVTPGRGLDYSIAIGFLSYVFGHEAGRELKRLVEAPLFADSAVTVGIQIADTIAALIYANTYLYKLAPDGAIPELGYLDYTHIRPFWKPLRDLRFVSEKLYEGYIVYGFDLFDHREQSNQKSGK